MTTDLNTNSVALPSELTGRLRTTGLASEMASYLECDPCELPNQRRILADAQSGRIPARQHPVTRIWEVERADIPRIAEMYRPARLSPGVASHALADAAA